MPFDSEPSVEVTARDRMIRLRDHIAYKVPEAHFGMRDWTCGTAACIGGWAERLFFDQKVPSRPSDYTVGEALGLNRKKSDELFYCGFSPDTSGLVFSEITRAQAVAVLDHYLATGEIDWSVASQ